MGSISNWYSSVVEWASGKSFGIKWKTIWWVPADNFGKLNSDKPVITQLFKQIIYKL